MKTLMLVILSGAIIAIPAGASAQNAPAATAVSFPEWAYPVNPPVAPFDTVVALTMPGSGKHYTQAQIEDDFAPPDWFPDDHPPMPAVVANGRPSAVKACSKCHVSNGAGHPESSDLAGLSAAYIVAQMADFKNGQRKGKRATSMLPIANAATDEEVREAAKYYAALPRPAWTKVVEAATVPKSELRIGGMRFANDAGSEPIDNRIIELPQAPERAHMRDSRIGFAAYVPVGSVARGEALVKGGDGKTMACGSCHGADLKGIGDVPHLRGRSPMYFFRQLNDLKAGTRSGSNAVPMQPVVSNMSQDEMLAIAAYLATLAP